MPENHSQSTLRRKGRRVGCYETPSTDDASSWRKDSQRRNWKWRNSGKKCAS
jgi:hypothetical protein